MQTTTPIAKTTTSTTTTSTSSTSAIRPTTATTSAVLISSSGSQHIIRRSALPHHALLPHVQCKILSLQRPTKSLEDIFQSIIVNDDLNDDHHNEIYVTATVYGFGIPMHSMDANACTTRGYSTPTARIRNNNNNTNTNKLNTMRYPKEISWNEVLDLPVPWKDVLRDACIAFDIVGPSGEQLWGTTLSLFDSNGLMRSGKLKLQLYPKTKAFPYYGPKVCQTPGLSFFMPSKTNTWGSLFSTTTTTTRDTTTPQQQPVARKQVQVQQPQQQQQQQQQQQLKQHDALDDLRSEWWWKPYHRSADETSNSGNRNQLGYSLAHEAIDYKWKALLMLEQLQSKYNATTINNNTQQQYATTQQQTEKQHNNNMYWLDNFTMERCRQILSHDDDDDDDADLSPSSSEYYELTRNSYLIVELPIFSLPIVHEEQFYPHALHGASGSVSALDLALHKRHVIALAAAERTINTNNTTANNNNVQIALLKSKVVEEQDAGISLVTFLDPEREDINNPVEDKYRTLAHDLLRGVVDPTVKPDKQQRDRLLHIISHSQSHFLTREEKDLLWRFRFSLVDNRKALTKFLLAVDWTEDDEVVQAAELLEQWRKRSPIEVTDALKLLGKHVAFQTSLVRSYAIDTLANAPDDELQLYLLQLVQALKYEELNDTLHHRYTISSTTSSTTTTTTSTNSSLALFLIDRASKSTSLANYLYWYLKVEMLEDAKNRERYGIVFAALRDRLSKVYSSGELHSLSSSSHQDKHKSLSSIIGSVTTKLGSSSKLITSSFSSAVDTIDNGSAASTTAYAFAANNNNNNNNKIMSMWDRLLLQDQFITGIMECQMESREFRGKKDLKEKKLVELLTDRGYHSIKNNESVPIPSSPHVMACGVNPSSSKMFKSALYPAVVEFRVSSSQQDTTTPASATTTITKSPAVAEVDNGNKKKHNYLPSLSSTKVEVADEFLTSPRSAGISCSKTTVATTNPEQQQQHVYHAIFKTGDDLRQDQLVVMMVRLMDGLLKRGALNLCLRSYSILATSPTSGLVEFVSGSIPISQILANNNGSILQYFQKVAPSARQKYNVDQNILETYIRSCAGFCVITFLLGIGDRHLDNIMLLPSGHFFHIDFGFIFGRDPKPLPPPFRLTREMVDGMGGIESPEYSRFCSLACQAYNTLRKHAGLILNLLHLMSDAGIADLSNSPIADADGVIAKVAERFRLELSDEQAENFFLGLINESLAALAPRVMEVLHQLSVARR